MTETVARSDAEQLALDLREDLDTRWIPDVLADADLVHQLQRPRLTPDDVYIISVPRHGGGYRRVPFFSGSVISLMRQAVRLIRQRSDSLLSPTVCGYRTGANGSSTYSSEYRRFREMSIALAREHSYVVVADIARFFDSVHPATIQPQMAARLGGDWKTVDRFLSGLHEVGVGGLPAGYADARLIANMILSVVDEEISAEFTRWVDDYRIFVNSADEANKAIARFEATLHGMGFEANSKKLLVIPGEEYVQRFVGRSLDSVYHPQDDTEATIRSSLRSVFLRSISDGDRRSFRFSLPRLAEQGDDIAVNYALHQLRDNSVDAPRLVHYLSHFLDRKAIADEVEALALDGLRHEWILLRASPLLARTPLRQSTMHALAHTMRQTDSPALWGAVLRVLSVHHKTSLVRDALQSPPADLRAALAACFDMNWPVPTTLMTKGAPTLEALKQLGRAPLPRTDSLL